MMLLGILAGALTGLLLGLLGSGGSIITLPAFVYLLGVSTKPAIAMTLGAVGLTALISAAEHWRRGNLDFVIAIPFAIFATIGAWVGAKIGLITPDMVQLLLFAALMYVAAWRMLRKSTPTPAPVSLGAAAVAPAIASGSANDSARMTQLVKMAVTAFGVGVVTGIVGIGGGFLIIPGLVLVGGLDMKKALGTSLLVIAVKSGGGFYGYMNSVAVDYALMLEFTAVAIVGSFFGAALSKQMSAETLKRIFGWFVIVVATYICIKQGMIYWR